MTYREAARLRLAAAALPPGPRCRGRPSKEVLVVRAYRRRLIEALESLPATAAERAVLAVAVGVVRATN